MAEVESNPERIRYAQETGMIIYDPDGFKGSFISQCGDL